MKYLKILCFLWLVFFTEASFADGSIDGKFVGKESEGTPQTMSLIISTVLVLICTVASGLSSKALLPHKRPAVAGILVGVLIGVLAGGYAGVLAGWFAGGYAGVLAGGYTGVLAGGFAGVLAGEYGLTAPITMEWLGFCIGMILLEYSIVFGRIKYQQFKQKEEEA